MDVRPLEAIKAEYQQLLLELGNLALELHKKQQPRLRRLEELEMEGALATVAQKDEILAAKDRLLAEALKKEEVTSDCSDSLCERSSAE